MAIDLDMELRGKVSPALLVERTAQVLRQLLGAEPPAVRLEQMENGRRISRVDHELGEDGALYLLSFDGREDQVALTALRSEESTDVSLSFSVGATRSPSEFVLGLASALAVALEYRTTISDGFMFWTGQDVHEPLELCEKLKVRVHVGSFDQACNLLVGSRLA